MYVRVKTSKLSPNKSVQIVEGMRDTITGRVKQKVIRQVGVARDEEELKNLREVAAHIKTELEEREQPGLFSPEDGKAHKPAKDKAPDYSIDDYRNLQEEERRIVGISEAYGFVYDAIGFNGILTSARTKRSGEIIKHLVLARIANPQSKRASVNYLENNFGIKINLDSAYLAMDKLNERVIDKIQKRTLDTANALLGGKIDVLFYDATTLYFESFDEDELRSKGYSKDMKFNQTQLLLAIFVTESGLPVGYEVFPGKTYEGNTLSIALDNLKARYRINNLVFVADSGLLNQDNLSPLEQSGYHYIVGARIKNMSRDIKKTILDRSKYSRLTLADEEYETLELDLTGRKLLVSYSAKRAFKDSKDRNEAISKLKKKLTHTPGSKGLISNSAYKKYLNITKHQISLNEEKIAEEEAWDGLHGVVTNIPKLNHLEILSQYKGLWQIEETFRIAKHDLKIRPIFHFTEKRIRAHIAISFMALTCARYLQYRVTVQKYRMSPERIKMALSNMQLTILRHIKDKRLIAIPSKIPEDARIIYKVLGLKMNTSPY